MFNWVYVIATQEFIAGGPCELPVQAGQAVARLVRHPDPRTERYDGAGDIRPATAQEISDYDAAQLVGQTTARFDSEKLVKALAIWTAQKLNVPLATAKAEILTILRGL